MSVPLRPSVMVADCTSVIFSSFMSLSSVFVTLLCTNPLSASSSNLVIRGSEGNAVAGCAAAAAACDRGREEKALKSETLCCVLSVFVEDRRGREIIDLLLEESAPEMDAEHLHNDVRMADGIWCRYR